MPDTVDWAFGDHNGDAVAGRTPGRQMFERGVNAALAFAAAAAALASCSVRVCGANGRPADASKSMPNG
jgi:hypothetical protein